MIKKLIGTFMCVLLFAANVNAATVSVEGPAQVMEGEQFQLTIVGDFGSDGLLAGGLQLFYDSALIQVDGIQLDLNVDPDLSCPGAALCPVDPAGTVSIVWGQFLSDLIPSGAGPTLMATITFTALSPGVTPITAVDFSAFTGGWFGAGFVTIATPEFEGHSLTVNAGSAGLCDLTGGVTAATGAFAALTPVGTPVAGPIDIDSAAVALGSAGPADINSIDVNVGGFCFTTGPDALQCPSGGAVVPIVSIDAAALTFSGGSLGGILAVTAFSPTFGLNILVDFDFDSGTFFAADPARVLGTVSGTVEGACAGTFAQPELTLIKEVENGANPGGTESADAWTLTATGPSGFSGTTGVMSVVDPGDYNLSESGPAGYLASDWDCIGGTQVDGDTITLEPGDEATCTITNSAMGMVDLLKLTNGVENQTMVWNFTLSGPGVDESESSPPTKVFGGVKLMPGEEYSVCETGIPAGWTLEWQVDTDGDGIPDTIIPIVAGVNNDPVDPVTGFSRVYDPNYIAPPGQFTNDTRCVNFVVDVGNTLAFQIDNQFPGGEPRSTGFWKNWNTCTNGNQPATAAANGGPDDGWFILDDLLSAPGYTIGLLSLDGADCEDAVNVLDKREITGRNKKRASDAAYNLASQLLAAQVNLSGGAETCQAVDDAVNAGQALLVSIGFDGTGRYLRPKDGQDYDDANALATTLDEYNNGNLCGP